MRALYGSGRQVEALEVYRDTRRLLVDELGIEPSPALHELEQAILRQDLALTSQEAPAAPRSRAILVVATDPERLEDLLGIAEPLARRPARELILTRLLRDDGELVATNAALAERRGALEQQGVASRIATYTTSEPGVEVARLATENDVDLILLDAASELLESGPDRDLVALLERAPCDVGLLSGSWTRWSRGRSWHRSEVSSTTGPRSRWQLGSPKHSARRSGSSEPRRIPRSGAAMPVGFSPAPRFWCSRLLESPLSLFSSAAGEAGVLEASRDARLLVIGLSDRWRIEGIGPARAAVAVGAEVPTLFVRRGLRPGGVAPSETLTRFTWTLGSEWMVPPEV